MELVINKKTYTLQNVNSVRRQFFISKVLPNYNQQGDFDQFILDTKKILLDKYNLDLSVEKTKQSFFKEFSKIINEGIWIFLKSEDKKEIGVIENIDIEKDEIIKFINFVFLKIKTYYEYVGYKSSEVKGEEIETIFAYLSMSFGWKFEDMLEMDELQLLKALEEAIQLKKSEQIEQINSNALAGAYASGSKKAKNEIDKLNRKLSSDRNLKKLIKSNPKLEMKNELTREQLQKIMDADEEAKQHGR